MAENIVNVPLSKFDDATLKIDCAKSIVEGFGILMSEVKESPITGNTINSMMHGVSMLLESAVTDLLANPSDSVQA